MGANFPTAKRRSTAAEVRRFREGDPDAAEALARRATRLAQRTAAALLESREEAADIAQDVAVDTLRSLSKLRDPAAFDAWVHRITVRHALRRLRRRRRARAREMPLALLPEAAEPAVPEGVDRDAVIAARLALAAALPALPPRQRLALALRYVHDLADAEIATALGPCPRRARGSPRPSTGRRLTPLRTADRLAGLRALALMDLAVLACFFASFGYSRRVRSHAVSSPRPAWPSTRASAWSRSVGPSRSAGASASRATLICRASAKLDTVSLGWRPSRL